MSCELLSHLEANGYCVIDRYLAASVLQSLIAGFDDPNDSKDSARLSAGVREKRGVRFARRNLLSSALVRDFIASEPVRSLIECIDPTAVAVRAILFDKTGDANWAVPWHQDRSIAVETKIETPGFGPWSNKAGVVHVQPPIGVLEKMFTLRFSLDACGADNGPLRIIAATHTGILNTAEIEHAVQNRTESIGAMQAGGVLIMRPLILHASSPAKFVGHRRILHIEFGPPTLPGELRWAMV